MRILIPAVFLALSAPLIAQEPEGRVAATTGELKYPRDRDRVVARVDGSPITFGQLVDHVEARHAPGFSEFLATPAGGRYLEAPARFAADWVRQFADITALMEEARRRGLDLDDAEPVLSEALKQGFQTHLEREQKAGRIHELTEELVNLRLIRYQQERGLQTEVEGWMNFLVPDDVPDDVLRDYFNGHARDLGGRLTFAHILVYDRDPISLKLYEGEERKAALEKIADIKARLADDGTNFEDVAAGFSDDRKTAQRGGVFRNVARFDDRLPAILTRTAWNLADGQIAGPVPSPFGQHFVKRISHNQIRYLLLTPNTRPDILEHMRRDMKEDLLFGLRDRLRVELKY